jgi:cytochrome c556
MKILVGMLALLAGSWALGALTADEDKLPSVKEIMKKANSPTGIHATLGQDLKDDAPNWDDIQDQARELLQLADALAKNKAPKGDPDSWKKRTKAYLDNAQELEKAAGKRDKRTALAAHGRMGGDACKACHTEHKKK